MLYLIGYIAYLRDKHGPENVWFLSWGVRPYHKYFGVYNGNLSSKFKIIKPWISRSIVKSNRKRDKFAHEVKKIDLILHWVHINIIRIF